MNDRIRIYGQSTVDVIVDPLHVLEKIDIGIPNEDWIVPENKDGHTYYVHMETVSAGQHSFSQEVKRVSKVQYDLYRSKVMLIDYIRSHRK